MRFKLWLEFKEALDAIAACLFEFRDQTVLQAGNVFLDDFHGLRIIRRDLMGDSLAHRVFLQIGGKCLAFIVEAPGRT